MQKLTRVSNFDIWYLDNFYDDPDHVRDFAINTPHFYRLKEDFWPGSRIGDLRYKHKKIYGKFYSYFLEQLNEKISLFNVNDCFQITTSFDKIPIADDNLKSISNTGYIHVDLLEGEISDKKTFAGVVYLNKIAHPNSGTSFFKLKCTSDEKIKISDGNNFNLVENSFDGYIYNDLFREYANSYNPFVKQKYRNYFLELKQFVDSRFEKVIEVENVYNRLVIYDSNYFHTTSHFYANDFEDRLIQPFFVRTL